MSDKGWNAKFSKGDQISLGFQVQFEAEFGPPESAKSLIVDGVPMCGTVYTCLIVWFTC